MTHASAARPSDPPGTPPVSPSPLFFHFVQKKKKCRKCPSPQTPAPRGVPVKGPWCARVHGRREGVNLGTGRTGVLPRLGGVSTFRPVSLLPFSRTPGEESPMVRRSQTPSARGTLRVSMSPSYPRLPNWLGCRGDRDPPSTHPSRS